MLIRMDGEAIDVGDLDAEALFELKMELQKRIDSLDTKINLEKRRASADGIYCDPKRFTRLEAIRKRLGRMMQVVQHQQGTEKRDRQKTFECRFVDAARQVLDPEAWDAIMRAVERDG